VTFEPIGTRDMISTPPAMTMSCVSLITACAAKCSACCDEPHWRSTLTPGTLSGSDEESTQLRAMLPACAPLCVTQPKITSSIELASRFARATSASIVMPPRSAACIVLSRPFFLPPAVRVAAAMYALAMCLSPPSSERAARRQAK
jgi:hypothetical protein